ncbi:MAG: hypothetical protein HZB26_16775 [Candidatus Hydrogenedentes bacterium]|nr:hypothetical protein [Candidatus Hydrogenedentota bacterium]
MLNAALLGFIFLAASGDANPVPADELLGADFTLANVVPPLEPLGAPKQLPIAVEPFIEHVRESVPGAPVENVKSIRFDSKGRLAVLTGNEIAVREDNGQWSRASQPAEADPQRPQGVTITATAKRGADAWYGTPNALYHSDAANKAAVRHESYGTGGPLATQITALVFDSKGKLWVGTPLGISVTASAGVYTVWMHIRGKQGLPIEDVTAMAVDSHDNLWIGTSHGAILYKPVETGRKWFYRQGKRYLPDDKILAVACAPDDSPYFVTGAGVSHIKFVKTTLLEKAQTIEKRVNERHRRLGLVAECDLNDAENPTASIIGDNDNDGLWTAYHVAAMSLRYAATHDPAAKESAKQSMHADYMLQNASGTPGLVARSVVPVEEGKKKEEAWRAKATEAQIQAGFQWRPAPDGKYYWKSDTSSDEIDGHYLAFYAYWEHIAKDDPAEKELCVKQVRALTDYIVDHNYQLIDWNGKRTRWGFWNPETLNGDPNDCDENGLNALQMLSFLKVAHHITGDAKYKEHYRKLIVEHGYLSNVLLSKKAFPDTNNHSDDQLGFVAWYPILQLEKDPKVRAALHAGVRRHYMVVEPEKPSFYIFAYATIDPNHADIPAGVQNLREIPTDRRGWAVKNSIRDDVTFDTRVDRFSERQLLYVLPADERCIAKWNRNPYVPDEGGDGRHEDDGAAYLLPYWMARYHGFIKE